MTMMNQARAIVYLGIMTFLLVVGHAQDNVDRITLLGCSALAVAAVGLAGNLTTAAVVRELMTARRVTPTWRDGNVATARLLVWLAVWASAAPFAILALVVR
jgi:hypothetical protein